ncbi:MAG TPA: Ig-like domain-containing protein [Candidatus Acidoferrales bacterium]|jgi:hypothetical protein|nr:Ig-like domain-containing protein [Candidatus Acidoferrales bacterium]
MSAYSRPLRFVFTAMMLPALALSLAAGCSSTISGPGPVPTSSTRPTPTPTSSPTPSGVLLRGHPIDLSFSSQGDAGALLVPKQIDVPANDYATVAAGPSPQAGMPPIPRVPAPFYTRPILYTAVTFSKRTTMQHLLGLTFALPDSIDPNFGTFFLAVYNGHGWSNVASRKGASGQTITFVPAGAMTTYAATAPHGVALWQLADAETPTPQPSPSTVQFTEVGQTAKIDVTEPDYYGKWTARSSNPSVATVSPNGLGGPHFTVTAAKHGKTTISFTDSSGGTGNVLVGVTTSGGGIH